MKFSRGFTMIELLVVVAIIGMLSSIILSALNSSRNKGANASIKENLANARAQAELYMETDSPNGYGGVCSVGPSAGGVKSIRDMVAAAYASSRATSVSYVIGTGNQIDTTLAVCHAQSANWAVSVPLKIAEGANLYWCVDSTGISAGRINPLGVLYACPAT